MAKYNSRLKGAFRKWGKSRSLEIAMLQFMKMAGVDKEVIAQNKSQNLGEVHPGEFKQEMQKYLKDNSK